jgi:GT2 family glycosyltransferase
MLKRRQVKILARKVAIAFAQPAPASPAVSIIIPVHNQVAYTLDCVLSIHEIQPQATYELIILDDESTDETRELLDGIPGIRYIRNTGNLGFLQSCNRAAGEAAGEYLLFLNNDTRVHPGWLDRLLETFSLVPGTGLAGSKLILPDGRLQEAGGVIWADGSASNCGRLADPRDYRYSYVREADYVSGASILIPRRLWEQLGGFDEAYSPAYYEDVDLAFRVRRAGHKVIYQPFSELTHIEGGSNGIDLNIGIKRYQALNQHKFHEAWQAVIASHGPRAETIGADAQRRYSGKRVLYIDDGTPKPDRYAGGVLTEFYISTLADAGYAVTFLPHLDLRHADSYTEALQKQGVECVYIPFVASSREYIMQHGREFDYIVLSRANVASDLIDTVKRFAPRAKVLFSTIDLHFLRLERAAQVSGNEKDLHIAQQTREDELCVMERSDCTLVVTSAEADLLAGILPQAKVRVVPFPADVQPVQNGFGARKDIVFLGGFGHVPNVDAVLFFAKEVWPALSTELPEARFVIAGAEVVPQIQQLHGDRIVVQGYVEDLSSLFSTARLSIAPLRFGAGLKGKILTSLGYGVPCVASSIATEGTGLKHLENVLVADTADEIIRQVLSLYASEDLWKALSQRGQDWIRQNYSRGVVGSKLLDTLRELD